MTKYPAIYLAVILVSVLLASPAWAVQSHGGIEGLISHQIGHLLFTVGMAYLLLRIKTIQLKGSGWFEFKAFLWLLLAWNILTFSGHWMNENVPDDKFLRFGTNILAFTADSFSDFFYYLTRLDHLILVPSFAFLLMALKKWRFQ